MNQTVKMPAEAAKPPAEPPKSKLMNQSSKMSDKAAEPPAEPPKSKLMNQSSKMSDKAAEPPAEPPKSKLMNQSSKMSDKAAEPPAEPPKSKLMNQSSKISDKAVEPPAEPPKSKLMNQSSKMSDKAAKPPAEPPKSKLMNQSSKIPDKAAEPSFAKPGKSKLMNLSVKMPDKAMEPPARTIKTWPRMENEYEEVVKHKSSCGWYIGCKVCHEWSDTNTVGYRAGEIKMQSPFAYYYFKQHCRSVTHQECIRKMEHYEKNEEGKRKRTIQPLLPWAIRPSTSESDAKRRKVGVPNEMAQQGGTTFEENEKIREQEYKVVAPVFDSEEKFLKGREQGKAVKFASRFPASNLCHGLMAQTDLESVKFQENMKLYIKYYNQEEDNQFQLKYYADKTEGTEIYSFFTMHCNNEDVQ